MPTSTATQPLVSIVIVNWNGLEDTKICLEHTREQSYAACEIVVVDNGSTQDSLDFLRAQTDIVLVENPKNLGFTGGHIAGYQAASGEYILLLNNDAVMDEHYVERAVAVMQADPTIAVVGGRAYLWDQDNPLFDVTNEFYAYQNINPITAEGIFAREDEGIPQEVNNVSGSCVLVRRKVIEEVGYLHDPFFAYFEESDLFARIKRAGFRIIYHPKLAIWHANGKSAERKGSTFGFYMMMRNRFRFAVRNFDSWSLARFLKFYLKMGIVSTLKAVLRGKTHPMEQAYAKAFFYNLFCGWVAFAERRQLRKTLGKCHNYNQCIVREQTGISLIIDCSTTADVDAARTLAQNLSATDEVVIVAQKPAVIAHAQKHCNLSSSPLRLCIDRGYFKAHRRNIAAICAKNDWLVFTEATADVASIRALADAPIYQAHKTGKQLAYGCPQAAPLVSNAHAAAQIACSSTLLVHKTLFVNAGGLRADMPESDALRALLVYGVISNSLVCTTINAASGQLAPLSNAVEPDDLSAMMNSAYGEATAARRKQTVMDRFLARHYHTQQILNIGIWWVSRRITLRLKLARTKNIVLAIMSLRRQRLATELKHIRNELLRNKYMVVDIESRKKAEHARLAYLAKHPQETTVFIICRDRYKPLAQLLEWLEHQGLQRVVLIDNNSALPPLMDFLHNTPYQVLEMQRNARHTVAWTAGIIKILLPDDFYLLTDPDVIPARTEADVLPHLYDLHQQYPDHLKIGLGLKIDDLPDHYELKKEVIAWEGQFWKHQYAPGVFEAGVDTTFAIYKPYTYQYFIHPSLRTAEPYTARHLPWYSKSDLLTDEEVFYRLRADQNVNTWDKGKLPERYVKELAKQRH
jgi:GT2 family glycosyltransferase